MAVPCEKLFEAFGQKDRAVGSRIAINAEIKEKIAQKATLGHLIRNYSLDNAGALAAL